MTEKGIINISKPMDYTSFDCVAIVRRALGIKKTGHTGTLDPMATGVLPVCVGSATRVIDYLSDDKKEYRGTLKLGLETDTYDIWGSPTAMQDVEIGETVSEEDVIKAIESQVGDIEQLPPMYAAIKVDGKKLYQYARAGQTVEVEPRKIHIDEIEILNIDGDSVDFRMLCSKGTYVRSFCHDVGAILGTGGCMSALQRSMNGCFDLSTALSIEDVKTMSREEVLEHMLPMDYALKNYPKVTLSKAEGIDFINGKHIVVRDKNVTDEEGVKVYLKADQKVRIYAEGMFLGMAYMSDKYHKLVADKVLDTTLKTME